MCDELNGIIVLDKPAGISSAKAVAEVKEALGAAKVGHTGTLDPFATGVLLCCIHQATRLARFFLHGHKCYEGVLRLGTVTDTQDATGRIVASRSVPILTEESLASAFSRFEGWQMQQPPAYAALKHEGTPLYKLARQGTPVQKPPRPVRVSLRMLEIKLPDIRFEVNCSAGTYVRTLCADIGDVLGCGGHLAELRRTACCGFTLAQAVSLDRLRELGRDRVSRLLVPMADSLKEMPVIRADGDLLKHLCHGKTLTADRIADHAIERTAPAQHPVDYLKVVDEEGRLRAVLQAADGGLKYNYCCVFN
ncbi:MAG: tRNA pseudouridine(55) synthase TruB [Desulfobacteraceae bacterium]|nr:MAG: tRNA pseudouridine(55) synthase TruB [Desulfobacteraceae bacterium]